MKFVFTVFIFIAAFLSPQTVWAQLDSSYELLLGPHASGSRADVRSESSSTKKTSQKRKLSTVPEEPSTKVEIPQGPPMPVKLEPIPPTIPKVEEPTISQQAQSLFTAQPEKIIGFYQERFDAEDPRQNKIEISFAPSYVTNESSSNYSFRDYRSVFSGMNLGANVWLTPAIGMGGNFMFSLGADTSGDAATNTRSPVRYEFLEVALKFRQFFGFSPLSKSVDLDVLYSDSTMSVNADDMYRTELKTSGIGLKMNLRVPSSRDVAWFAGGRFYPRMHHSEVKTGIEAKSGNNTENVRLGVQVGAEVTLSRQSQVFFEAAALSEKNLFNGAAQLVDPALGGKPENVSVTNAFYIFSMGYRWGN